MDMANQAQAEPQVFISTRFNESATEANMVKAGLQSRGVNAFLCNERAGTDLQDAIADALDASKVHVMLATATYGAKTNQGFSTRQEMNEIYENGNPFLIKMCHKWEVTAARLTLGGKMYVEWTPGTPMPDTLIDDIIAKLKAAGGQAGSGAAGPSVEAAGAALRKASLNGGKRVHGSGAANATPKERLATLRVKVKGNAGAGGGRTEGLVELLQKGTAEDAEYAAEALRELARAGADNVAANRAAIAKAGAIGPLVRLLQMGTAEGQEHAAGALANLAVNAANKVAVAAAGAIGPLVQLLQTGTAGGKENAAAALWNLAVNADNQAAIVAAGAVAPLQQLQRTGTAKGKEKAAKALKALGHA